MCKPLHIEYGARLTYRQAVGYLVLLVEYGFLLKKKMKSRPYQYYEITDKGRHYLQVYSEIEDNLRPVVNPSSS
jgi:predicted transcriptional regulator